MGESGFVAAWCAGDWLPAAELASSAIVSNATPMTVPAALLESTIQAVMRGHKAGSATAGVAVSASVSRLAEGVLRAMLWTKVKTMISLTLATGVTVLSLGLLARGADDDPRRDVSKRLASLRSRRPPRRPNRR